MTNYSCQRCGYENNKKYNFKKHIYRKFTCPSKLKEIDIIDIRREFEIQEMNRSNYNVMNCQKNVINAIKINKQYTCNYCNKSFNKRQNRWRHEKDFCKEKQKQETMEKKIKQMEYEISQLKKQKNKTDSIVNNKNNNNNSNNNINSHNTIIVNNFGEENIEYITDKMFKRLILKGSQGIPSLIKQIHFNPKHPENHNVRINNKKSKYAEVIEDKKWRYKHKKSFLDDLVDFGYITLEEFKENNEDIMDSLLVKGFNRMMSKYEKNKNKLIDDVELEVLNGSRDIDI